MARFRRLTVLQRIIDSGLVPVFYHPDADVAIEVARACADGGAACLEFTHRGDGAHRVFEELVARFPEAAPGLLLGVGSILDPHTAALYLAMGTDFIVGPSVDAGVARLCNRRKVAYIPGCGSLTEIARAEELGSEIVKLFPGGSVGGPSFVKSILGPCPWTSIMPTGGVDPTPEGLNPWFEAGVVAVGVGSKLISDELIQARDWDGLSANVKQVLGWIRDART